MVMSMFEGTEDHLSYTLRAVKDDKGKWKYDEHKMVVGSFKAREGLSALFEWQIDVAVDTESIPTLEDTLGQDAEFNILRDGKVLRVVRGIIAEVTPQTTSRRQSHITLTLVPKLAELQYVTNNRVYQGETGDRKLTVDKVVEAMFKPYGGIDTYWRVPKPEAREYRVQKDETDYEFFCRLLADAGIHFHFLHDDKKTQVILVDDPKGYQPIEGDAELPYQETGGAVTVDHVGSMHRTRRLRPGRVLMQDYDLTRPWNDMEVKQELPEPHDAERAPRRQTYIYPGNYDREHRDNDGKALAKRRLEEARSDAFLFGGRSSCVRFEVGRKFKLENHPDDVYEREYLITEITLEGHRAGVFADSGKGKSAPGFVANFAAVPSDTRLQPARRPRPPSPPETAKVVGPQTGSPWVDQYGRVKVQFAWDRDGKWDEMSSCWLRVMTPSAGSDRGIWFPPRVGDEVVIMFFDGDLDRPFVAGAMYNATDTQQYHPVDKHYSKNTIRTRTVPFNGKGFNEITLDDLAGKEEIFLHAQKNLREVVLANHSESIGANQSTNVGANQDITIGKDRKETVHGTEHIVIDKKRYEHVHADEEVIIDHGRKHTIADSGDKLTIIEGDRTVILFAGNHITKVPHMTELETENSKTHASNSIHARGDIGVRLMQGNSFYHMAGDAVSLSANEELSIINEAQQLHFQKGNITLTATKEMVLKCGNASISLKEDGTIAIVGTKAVTMACHKSTVSLDPKSSTVEGTSAKITAKGVCTVSGAFVKIN